MDYRTHIDNILSEYCNKHGVEFTDIHCEAFCVKRKDDTWLYLWYGYEEDMQNMLDYSVYIINKEFDIQEK